MLLDEPTLGRGLLFVFLFAARGWEPMLLTLRRAASSQIVLFPPTPPPPVGASEPTEFARGRRRDCPFGRIATVWRGVHMFKRGVVVW